MSLIYLQRLLLTSSTSWFIVCCNIKK